METATETRFVAYGLRPDRRCVSQETTSLKATLDEVRKAGFRKDDEGGKLYVGMEIWAITPRGERVIWFRLGHRGLCKKDYDFDVCRKCRFVPEFCQC